MKQTKKVSEDDIFNIEKCKIDYAQADALVKKMEATMPNNEKLT
jgi:hypothetical protein